MVHLLSGNIPPEIQQMMNSMKSSDNNSSSNNSSNIDINKILSQVSPEMLNNLSSSLNSNSYSNNNNSNQNNFNLDMNTILKMKSIMENMNNKNDPRANLLYSLKPYLRESKKNNIFSKKAWQHVLCRVFHLESNCEFFQ